VWLIGKALAPFFALAILHAVGRPAALCVVFLLPSGRLRSILLARGIRYVFGCLLSIAGILLLGIVASLLSDG
jgi:hypothetical protein